ncbi:MAG: hypothetical protein CUN55_13770 [Phototrophicales bacterium]|nr:MAG: hypothetical protein CUN55_13770 [Phototrophicales bacterium]
MEKTHYINTLIERAWQLLPSDATHTNILVEEALQISQREQYALGEADALTIRSRIFLESHTYDEAITTAHEAIRLYEKLQTTEGLKLYPYAVATLAESYMVLGDYETALFWLERQIDIAEWLRNTEAQASAYQNMSIIYGYMNDHRTALRYLHDASEIASPSQQPRLYQLGAEYALVLKDFESAIDNATIALQGYEALGSASGQALAHSTLGDIYLAMGDPKTARTHYEWAWQFSRHTSRPMATLRSLLQLGKLAVYEQQWESAAENFKGALAFAEANEHHQEQLTCHKALADILEKLGNFREALYHAKRYAELRDEILTQEANLRIQRLDMLQRTRIAQRESEFYAERARQLQALRERDRVYFQELSNIKDEMMRTASHDLKNPLATIRTLVYLLRAEEASAYSPERRQELLERIDQQVDRMTDLISNLLDLAKLETGRAINTQPLPVKDVIVQSIEDVVPLAEARRITIEQQIGDHEAYLDPPRIRQVMVNLLSNAIKYSEAGSKVTVRTSHTNNAVIVEVCDEGVGIPAEDIPRIFERFYRVEKDAHRAREGTGLGLAIVKSIVEQHGGEISVESTVGQGSIFRFTLPIVQKEQ